MRGFTNNRETLQRTFMCVILFVAYNGIQRINNLLKRDKRDDLYEDQSLRVLEHQNFVTVLKI